MLKFKNIIFILIVIALSSMIIPASTSAASTTTFYVDNVSAKPGDNITIPVMIKNNKGFVSTSLCIEYDSSVLTLLGVEDKNLIAGALHTTNFVSPYILSWENDTKTSNYTVNGTLVELSFAVSIFAEPGEYSITVTSPLDGVLDCNGDDVDCSFTNGKLTVLSPECDHSWSVWKKSNTSRHKRSCNYCGEIETELHDWDDGVITIEPGPGVGGEKTYTCETCRYQNVEIIDPEPDSHEHNFIKSSVVSPTCTQEGYTLYVCDDCSAIKKENITASLGHSYTSSVVAPTCSSNGYTLNTCSRCNDQTRGNYVPAVDHKYQNGKCVYCGIEDPSADLLCDLALVDCYDWYQTDPFTGNITREFNLGVKNLGTEMSGTYLLTMRKDSPTGEIIYQTPNNDLYSGKQHNYWVGNIGITDTVVYYISIEYDYDTDRSNNYTLLVAAPYVEDEYEHNHFYEQFVDNGESGHKSICLNRCGEYLIQPHWYDFDNSTECVICGHSKNHTHSFSDWTNLNENQHKRTCSCGEVEYGNHAWDSGVITKKPTATTNGIKKFTCTVCNATRIEEIISDIIAVTGIALSDEAVTMKIGESFLLMASVLPDNATNRTVIWTCDNSSVIQINKAISNTAYVDLVALTSGVATITAKTEDGHYSAQCTVVVIDPDSISVNLSASITYFVSAFRTKNHLDITNTGGKSIENVTISVNEGTPTGNLVYGDLIIHDPCDALNPGETYEWYFMSDRLENDNIVYFVTVRYTVDSHEYVEYINIIVPPPVNGELVNWHTYDRILSFNTNDHIFGCSYHAECSSTVTEPHWFATATSTECVICGFEREKTEVPTVELTASPQKITLGESFTYSGTAYGNDYELNAVTIGISYFTSEANYKNNVGDSVYFRTTGLLTSEKSVSGTIFTGTGKYITGTNNTGTSSFTLYTDKAGIYTVTLHGYSSEYGKDVRMTVRVDVVEPEAPEHTHAFSSWSKHSTTQHKRTCSCGEVEYADHTWDAGVVTTQPTCIKSGIKTYTCSICKATKAQIIAASQNHIAQNTYSNVYITVNKEAVQTGDIVEVVMFCNKMTVCTISGGIKFDTTKFECISIVGADDRYPNDFYLLDQNGEVKKPTALATVNDANTVGVVSAIFVGTEDIDYQSGVIWTATFKAKVSGTASFTVFEDSNGTDGKRVDQCGAYWYIIPATCVTNGYKIQKCVACGTTVSTESIQALAHSWDSGVVTTQPTCVKEGTKNFTCLTCKTTKTEAVAATGKHTTGSWTTTKEATCIATGTKVQKCTVCDIAVNTQTIAKLGHSWDSGTVTTKPNCIKEGIRTYTCSSCKTTKTEKLPVITKHSIMVVSAKAPTCTKWGNIKHYECIDCHTLWLDVGLTLITNGKGVSLEPEHSWNTGIISTPPTYTTGGVMTYTCTVCKENKFEYIPSSPMPDVNTDGEIDETDAETILKYITGNEFSVVEAALDVNGDGKVNIRDAATILLYLDGKNVELN